MVHKRGKIYFAASIIALSCSVSASAFAESTPDTYFYPAKKWVVGQAPSSSSSALKTCTISNQFNNGFIVQFAGNQDGFTNVNLDVRKATFEKNRRYEVEYSVPGISRDIIPTKAFKDNLLVSDLRQKDEFTNSLRMASVIDVKIQGNGFRLYLTGLEAAMKDYAECLGPKENKIGRTPQIIQKNHTIDEDAEIVTGEIRIDPPSEEILGSAQPAEKSAQENKQSVSLLKEPPRSVQDLKPEIVKQDTVKVERYTETLAREMDAYNETFEPDTARALPPKQAAQKDVKIVRISDTPEVTSDIGEPSSSNIITPRHKPSKAGMPVNIASSSGQTPSSRSLLNAKPEEILQSLEREEPEILAQDARDLAAIEPSAPAPAQDSRDFINMRNKIAEMEDKLSALKAEKSLLNEELKTVLKESEDERLSISSNNWNLERATMRYNEAERQIDRLGRQLKNARQQCTQEKTELEQLLFDPQLTEQKQISELSTLEEELDKTKTDFSIQKRQYEERIRILEEQLGKL